MAKLVDSSNALNRSSMVMGAAIEEVAERFAKASDMEIANLFWAMRKLRFQVSHIAFY